MTPLRTHRYILRSRPGKPNDQPVPPVYVPAFQKVSKPIGSPNRSTTRAPSPNARSSKAAKSLKAAEYIKLEPVTAASPGKAAEFVHRISRLKGPTDTALLFIPTWSWTPEHLKIANMEQEIDVPIDRIVDGKHIPSDDGPGTLTPPD
ncbi:hypothetical protein BJX99DRAFT_256936 [Aspergillus californicus]